MDAAEYRASSQDQWERSAAGWERRREQVQRFNAPLSQWLVEAVDPQPGQRVLELAAGPGDTGLMAAELVAPAGTLILTDVAEPMLDVARRRAAELGITNVEYKVVDAESIDLDTASVDVVLCRFGYMLMADPAAALRETRRVLRPGGKLALAVWDGPAANRWVTALADAMIERGVVPPRDPGGPGMFALAPPDRLRDALIEAGFYDVATQTLELDYAYADADDWWDMSLDLGRPLAKAVAGADPALVEAAKAAALAELEQYRREDGSLHVPAHPIAARATA
jgi:SAM-dependent methyltransferase